MNVTLAIPAELAAKARALAARRSTTLNQLVRDFLERETEGDPALEALSRLQRHWSTSTAKSNGRKLTRDELYAERLK